MLGQPSEALPRRAAWTQCQDMMEAADLRHLHQNVEEIAALLGYRLFEEVIFIMIAIQYGFQLAVIFFHQTLQNLAVMGLNMSDMSLV